MSEQAQTPTLDGWYVLAEVQQPQAKVQFWMAAYADPAQAIAAVSSAPSVLTNAKISTLAKAKPNVLAAYGLKGNDVVCYAP